MASKAASNGPLSESSHTTGASRATASAHPLTTATVQRVAAVEMERDKRRGLRQLEQIESAACEGDEGGAADAGEKGPSRSPRLARRATINDVLFPPEALCGMSLQNPIRMACVRVILSDWFNPLIIALIALNCVFLCLYDPLNPTGTVRARVLEVSEYVFTVLFTIEAGIKIFAFGFVIPKKAYLRNPWNALDFGVVSMGYISLVPGVSNVSALRTFRVLRPLRTLTTVPGMRIIVTSMLASLPALFNIVLLCTFIFLVFGIVGLQLWSGVMRGRCHFVTTGQVDPLDDAACALPCRPDIFPSFPTCPFSTGRSCGPVPTRDGVQARECLPMENRNFGFTNFDNIGSAILAIFTSITLEGWTDILYDLMNSFGMPVLTVTYFVLLIMFGSYFMLNLTLAVIWAEYEKAMDELRAKEAKFLEELITNDLEDEEMHALSKVMGIGSVSRAMVLNIRAAKVRARADADEPDARAMSPLSLNAGNSAADSSAGAHAAGGRPSSAPHAEEDASLSDSSTGHPSVAGRVPNAERSGASRTQHAGRPGMHQDSLPPVRAPSAQSAGVNSRAGEAGSSGDVAAAVPSAEPAPRNSQLEPPGADAGAGLGPDLLARELARSVPTVHGSAGSSSVPTLDVGRLQHPVTDRGAEYESQRSRRAAAQFVTSAMQDQVAHGTRASNLGGSNLGGSHRGGSMLSTRSHTSKTPRKRSPRTHFESQEARDVWDELERMKLETPREDPLEGCVPIPRLRPLLDADWFNLLVTGVIVLNTAALGAEYYGMSTAYRTALESLNYVFTAFFTIEVVLKLLGFGWARFAADRFNIFDLVVVLVSVMEIILAVFNVGDSAGLSALRSFRLLRVFKLARSWKSLRELLQTIFQSVVDVSYASVVLLILIFIFTLLGLQLFGGAYTVSVPGSSAANATSLAVDGVFDEKPRAHFDNLYWSFVTVFQVLTGENWNEVLYDAMKASGPGLAVAYFTCLNVVGNYLILNLFLTILLANFEGGGDDERMELEDHQPGMPTGVLPADAAASPRTRGFDGHASRRSNAGAVPRSSQVAPMASDASLEKDQRSQQRPQQQRLPHRRSSSVASLSVVKVHPEASRRFSATGAPSPEPAGSILLVRSSNDPAQGDAETGGDRDIVVSGWSLYLFHESNPLRRAVAWFVKHRNFDRFILALIVLSSVLLAIDEPRIRECNGEPGSTSSSCKTFFDILQVTDLVFTAIFLVEAVLKIIAMGLIVGKHAYLRNGWNVLDCSIVIISVISAGAGGNQDLKALRALRALRGLRPLRAVSRFPGLKVVVNSIFRALPAVGGAALVNVLFFLIFAIVGMQNWLGALNQCNDPTIALKVDCVGNFSLDPEQCSMMPTEREVELCILGNATHFTRRWEAQTQNFNHLGSAILTVFEVATGEMWPNIMYATVDAVGLDKPQERDHNPAAALYFIMIQVVCNFLMLNVFVGVVVENFNQQKQEHEGSALLTPAQRLWVEQTKLMLNSQPVPPLPPPSQSYRLPLFRVVTHRRFELFIMGCIILNAVLMATRHFGQSSGWTQFLEAMNWVFVVVFTLEAVLKLIALGPREYFKRRWNCFDFALVAMSYIGLALPGDAARFATLARIVRVARIFRLVRTSPGLLNLFKTLIFSLPSLGNIGAVLLLVYFIFAVLAMNLFSDVKHGEFLTSDANFGSFGASLLTLFRITTGESFNGIMHDCSIQPPYCDPVVAKNCGDPVIAPLFIIVFLVVVAFGILNFLVAVLIDSFSDTVAISEATVTPDDIDEFKALWTEFDPKGRQFISREALVEFLQRLRAPLGVAGLPGVIDTKRAALRLLHQVDIPVHESGVQYNEVLVSLANQASQGVGDTLPHDFSTEMNKIKVKSVAYRRGTVLVGNVAPMATSRQHGAAMLIQAAWRGFIIRKYGNDGQTRRAKLMGIAGSIRALQGAGAGGHEGKNGDESGDVPG